LDADQIDSNNLSTDSNSVVDSSALESESQSIFLKSASEISDFKMSCSRDELEQNEADKLQHHEEFAKPFNLESDCMNAPTEDTPNKLP
jgi:hypothetical protein